MRKAGRDMPSADRSSLPATMKMTRTTAAIAQAVTAIFDRSANEAPVVSARKIGIMPIGSIVTNRVARMFTNWSRDMVAVSGPEGFPGFSVGPDCHWCHPGAVQVYPDAL